MSNKFLETEKLELEKKIVNSRNQNNEGTYKNLIQAYERVLELIRRESKWEQRYSYNNPNEVLSTWEQNGDDIRNKKEYKAKEIVKKIENKKVSIDYKVRKDIINCSVTTKPMYDENGELKEYKNKVSLSGEFDKDDMPEHIKCFKAEYLDDTIIIYDLNKIYDKDNIFKGIVEYEFGIGNIEMK